MEILKAYRFEIMPNSGQQAAMRRTIGCCRYVYNEALKVQNKRRAEGQKPLSEFDLVNLLPEWKAKDEWLKKAPAHPLQQALRDLHRAFVNFYEKRAAFPVKQKKFKKDSFRFPAPKQFVVDQGNALITLPKFGKIRYRKSRNIEGTIKNLTVSCKNERWYIAIQTSQNVHVSPASGEVGVDRGIAHFAALSNDAFVDRSPAMLKRLEALEARRARYQRAMSRKQGPVKGKRRASNNWKKSLRKTQRISAKIAHIRQDFLHKESRKLVNDNGFIVFEDLNIKGMTTSASGTLEAPGKRVAQKRGLNRSILEQGWGAFARMVEYKNAWNGGITLYIPPQYTSQTCAACGHVDRENRKSQADFHCIQCGHQDNADVNAAKNILAWGHRVLACGALVQQGSAVKQEPTETQTQGAKPCNGS